MSDLPITVDLSAYRGDNWTQSFRLLKNGSPLVLDDVEIKSSALHISTALDTALGVTKEPDPGVFTIALPTDIHAGNYKYDIKLVDDSNVQTWIKGMLHIEKDVTDVAA